MRARSFARILELVPKSKKVLFRHEHWLFRLPLLRNYSAICLGRTIYFKRAAEQVSPELMAHENVHQEQMTQHGLVGFYSRYLIDYCVNLVKYRRHHEAYENIRFEIEARQKASDFIRRNKK